MHDFIVVTGPLFHSDGEIFNIFDDNYIFIVGAYVVFIIDNVFTADSGYYVIKDSVVGN